MHATFDNMYSTILLSIVLSCNIWKTSRMWWTVPVGVYDRGIQGYL